MFFIRPYRTITHIILRVRDGASAHSTFHSATDRFNPSKTSSVLHDNVIDPSLQVLVYHAPRNTYIDPSELGSLTAPNISYR